MSATDNSSIHRYLDQAFAGVELTPDLQDLKEELRGSLTARVDELIAAGTTPAAAAAKAVKELGDIGELIDSAEPASETTVAELVARNRVRPKPLFVTGAVVLALLIALGAAGVVLSVLHIADLGVVSAVIFALAAGALTDFSLRQETSQHYRVPSGRAIGFGSAALIGALGLSLSTLFIGGAPVALLVAGSILVVAAVLAFTWLGVTQTNRTKPWVFELNRSYNYEDPFSNDPAAAARFGMYTVVVWIIGITAFIVLSFTIGFVWSWLALVATLVVFFLLLAHMVFPADGSRQQKGK
jgi:MFS family permease